MPIKKILFLLFLTAPACAWAALDCGIDERPIMQTITVNEQANDLFLIPIYNPGTGEDELLATGGSGTLTDILNTWNENESSIGSNSFNIDTLSFTDTDAEFLENLGNSRYMVQFCLPNSTNSTTSHAVYKQGATVRGIFSGVGIVTGIGGNNEIDLILNHSNYSPNSLWIH